jgi:rhamnogalacturonan endolyase
MKGQAGGKPIFLFPQEQPSTGCLRMKTHTLIYAFLLSFVLASGVSSPAASVVREEPVKLSKLGDNVLMENGLLRVTINPAAAVSSLRYMGNEMASSIYYSMDGGTNYRNPAGGLYFVKTETPDLVDVGFKRERRNEPQAFDCEVHYVLKRGVSGLYTYAILKHPADYPASGIGEWRLVWKLPNSLLERIYTDEQRHWEMPGPDDYKKARTTGIKEIIQLTSGPRAGKYDCKYDYNASYHDIGCWGHASDKKGIGAWIVVGGYDFFNDGPTKQDLNAASGINHIHFGMNHYNGSSIRVDAGESWEKVFGPFLLYCNSRPDGGDACWKDAKDRVNREKAAWPYSWLADLPSYPPANGRGAVSGHLILKDPLKPQLKVANAWVGLAKIPPGGNWQFDSMSYQYWVKADALGYFTIPHVRPGTYTLYAFTDGVTGEYSKGDIIVEEGKTNALGPVTWHIPHKGKSIAWEIGTPDRTAKEFRHGNDYFRGYVWQNFQNEFANPLEYTVGKSDPSREWNYAHSWYQTGDQRLPWKWRIHFNLPKVPESGDAFLTLAFAGAHGHARVNVYVNDESRPLGAVTPSIRGGNAMLRESIHAKYCVEYFTIPVTRLRSGDNTITLEQTGTDVQSHVMYDSISLELP